METVEVKKESVLIFLNAEELRLLRFLVARGAMNLRIYEKDQKEYAEYFTITTNDL